MVGGDHYRSPPPKRRIHIYGQKREKMPQKKKGTLRICNVVCLFCVLHLCALQFSSFLAYQPTNILSSFVGFKFKQIKLEITFMNQLTQNKSDLETFDELESNCSEIRASASQSPPQTSSSSCIVNISVRRQQNLKEPHIYETSRNQIGT